MRPIEQQPAMAETAGISAALRRLVQDHLHPTLSVGDLVDGLGQRSFAFLLLVLALPHAVPVPGVPGLSAAFGIPMALISLQLALGKARPQLPGWLRSRGVATARLRRFIDRALPYLERVETMRRPRVSRRFSRPWDIVVGLALLVFSLALALPVPLGNLGPALSIVALALGRLEEDLVLTGLGLALGTLSLAWFAVLALAGSAALSAVAGIL